MQLFLVAYKQQSWAYAFWFIDKDFKTFLNMRIRNSLYFITTEYSDGDIKIYLYYVWWQTTFVGVLY